MVFLETYRVQTRSLQQQFEVGECRLADMDQVEVQAEDRLSRDTQLVSYGSPTATTAVLEYHHITCG